MKKTNRFISFLIVSGSFFLSMPAFANHGITYAIPNAEDCNPDVDSEENYCDVDLYSDSEKEEGVVKPWYATHNYRLEPYEEIENPTDRLNDNTAWPGQREDFSDILFRD